MSQEAYSIQPLVIGTAGHIDHGKSTLVKALTDIDPDRLKEEKERGLTIDLGFARFPLADGRVVGIVDVPLPPQVSTIGARLTTQFFLVDLPANALGIVSSGAVLTTVGEGL